MNFKSLALSTIAVTAAFGFAPVAAQAAPHSTETVALVAQATVHSYPGASAPTTGSVAATRPLTGSATVLPVIGKATANGVPWVRVLLPQRPDGSTGWISTNGTRVNQDPWYVAVNRETKKAVIYHSGKVMKSFTVIVGRPSMPTPAGLFFVAEIVDEGYGTITGPYALATSDYSNVLQEFDGGPGQIAMHGRVGLPEPLGTADSHGCIRYANQDITWIAQHITSGTPISIS
jgi:lipoprotein-anchoring transpeptidase ErfK/SrfK